MFTSDTSIYEISVAYIIETKQQNIIKTAVEKEFPELPSIQNFAAYSETSKYDKQSTLTWLSPFIFISKKNIFTDSDANQNIIRWESPV